MAVSVIAILMAIIIPAVGGAQRSAKRAKTRVQFSQWSAAIEQFRQEYGYYPVFAANRVNPESSAGLGSEHTFHDTLTARLRNGEPLPTTSTAPSAPHRQNPKRIAFCSFGSDELNANGLIQDAFGNIDIGVLMDRNLDSTIDLQGTTDYDSAPGAMLTIGGLTIPAPQANRIRAGVAFYSAGDGQTPVTSW